MKTRRVWSALGGTWLVGPSGCTFGPAESTASIAQVVRLPRSDDAMVVVQHMGFRRPTGLNTFPNGGRIQVLERSAVLHVIDGRAREVRRVEALTPFNPTFHEDHCAGFTR